MRVIAYAQQLQSDIAVTERCDENVTTVMYCMIIHLNLSSQ